MDFSRYHLWSEVRTCYFYQPELFKEDFWSVFLPIRTQPSFAFTGFSGLASHGAAIALILTTLYYSLKIIKKIRFGYMIG